MGDLMKDLAVRARDDEQGMSTAEYAVGVVAVCGLGGVLINVLKSSKMLDLIWNVVEQAFSFLF